MQTHNVRFAVSLSDGTNYIEEKGMIAGDEQASSWQKFCKIWAISGAQITSFVLFTDDGRTYHLPSSGSNPKFKFVKAIKPIDYNFFRAIAREMAMTGGKPGEQTIEDFYTVAEAVYPGYKVQLWVNERNTNDCRVVMTE